MSSPTETSVCHSESLSYHHLSRQICSPANPLLMPRLISISNATQSQKRDDGDGGGGRGNRTELTNYVRSVKAEEHFTNLITPLNLTVLCDIHFFFMLRLTNRFSAGFSFLLLIKKYTATQTAQRHPTNVLNLDEKSADETLNKFFYTKISQLHTFLPEK